MPHDDLPSLSLRVVRIVVDAGEPITEHGEPFLEGHPVLPEVRLGLLRIPNESQAHRAWMIPRKGSRLETW